jgi:hypothetical protein
MYYVNVRTLLRFTLLAHVSTVDMMITRAQYKEELVKFFFGLCPTIERNFHWV